MSMRRWLAEAFREFNVAFGLTAAHDYDLLDEPSAPAAASPWPPRPADASPLRLVPERADGPVPPDSSPGGAGIHPSQYPLTDVEAAGAEWLAALRTLLARLGDTCADVVEHIDRLGPTPTGLAQAAAVTDLDAHRR